MAIPPGQMLYYRRVRQDKDMIDEPALSSNALRALSIFCQVKDDLPWLMGYCSANGGLLQDMELFLRSLGKLLRSEFALCGWHLECKKPEEQEDSWVGLELFPANWDLSGFEPPVHFSLTWRNPFLSDRADRYLCVEVAAPRKWLHWEKLKHLLRPKLVPQGFTDKYERDDVDENSLFWKYVPFDHHGGYGIGHFEALDPGPASIPCAVRS